MSQNCVNYDPEYCPKDCKDEPRKCDLCKNIILGGFGEANSYVIKSAEAWCDNFEIVDLEMIICKDCFDKIKNMKK